MARPLSEISIASVSDNFRLDSSSFIILIFPPIAVRATLNAITTYHCKDALKFTIVERYDLKSSEDCSLAPDIGAIGSAFIAFGQDSSCNLNCFTSGKLSDLSIDKDYLVAGYYRKVEDSCDSVFWELLSGNSLIVSWEEKRLTSGKMDKYINEREC